MYKVAYAQLGEPGLTSLTRCKDESGILPKIDLSELFTWTRSVLSCVHDRIVLIEFRTYKSAGSNGQVLVRHGFNSFDMRLRRIVMSFSTAKVMKASRVL